MPTDNTSKQVSDSKDLDKPEDDEYASKPRLDGLHEHIEDSYSNTSSGDDTIILDPGEQQRWNGDG